MYEFSDVGTGTKSQNHNKNINDNQYIFGVLPQYLYNDPVLRKMLNGKS